MNGRHVVIVPSWWPSPEQPMAGVFFRDYATAFAAAGAKVGVVFPDLVSLRRVHRRIRVPVRSRIIVEELAEGIPVIRIRGLHTSLGRPPQYMQRFRKWLHRGLAAYAERFGRPDVLHAMCAIPAGWACTHLDDDLSPRTIVTEHTGPFERAMSPPSAAEMVLEALSHAAAVTAVSQRLRHEMTAAGVKREIDVIPNPVGEAFRYEPPPAVEESDDGRRGLCALFIGRLTAEKGVHELLDSAQLLSRDPEIHLRWHIAGDGPLMADVRKAAAGESMRDRIVVHGLCNHDKIAQLIRDSHLVVLPSHGENCPLAICEALSVGRPVVGTRSTGSEELIGPHDGGLCDAGDVGSFADAVEQILRDYGRWDHAAIAERAQRRFGGDAIAGTYAGIYERIVKCG